MSNINTQIIRDLAALPPSRRLNSQISEALNASADEIDRLYSLAKANNDLARRHAETIITMRARSVEALLPFARIANVILSEAPPEAVNAVFYVDHQSNHHKLTMDELRTLVVYLGDVT